MQGISFALQSLQSNLHVKIFFFFKVEGVSVTRPVEKLAQIIQRSTLKTAN